MLTPHASSCPALRQRTAALLLGCTAILAGCSEADKPAPAKASKPAAATQSGTASLLIARGKVELPGGALPIIAPVSGPLTSVAIREGAHVDAGDVLAVVDPAVAELRLKQAECKVRRAEAVLQAAADASVEAASQALRQARATAGGASDQQAAETANALRARRKTEQAIASRDLEIERSSRDLQRHFLAQHTLRAPQAGFVVRLDATVGRRVDPASSPLMVILPDVPQQVRAEVNESLAGRLHAGMPATVVVEGAAVDTGVPAHVLHVGEMFAASRLDENHPVRRNLRVVETLLTLDSDAALRVGQNVSVIFHE